MHELAVRRCLQWWCQWIAKTHAMTMCHCIALHCIRQTTSNHRTHQTHEAASITQLKFDINPCPNHNN